MASIKKHTVDLPFEWVPAAAGAVPANAIVAASRGDKALYICCVSFDDSDYLGEMQSGSEGCHIAMGGRELVVPTYDVLALREVSSMQGKSEIGDIVVRIFTLADALFSDKWASSFLSEAEQAYVRSSAIEIRNAALAGGCAELVIEAEKLKDCVSVNMPRRQDVRACVDRMKEIGQTCAEGKTV